ncbi:MULTISPECIES: ankyrin repeat domain-containing protein [Methylococcus]|jgi:ankyrin repeat protein|uniref:ankyrin repeat domain-containing protein n=1 Tax=Methylococcus TaxID=413 RepID=UPI001C53400B|nr:ankyrin repeat domain-containing protein [Methylococcus capsulatus]QXP91933.1 ankyrin repeat domain-containing protein [Methylococcus capsulatus]
MTIGRSRHDKSSLGLMLFAGALAVSHAPTSFAAADPAQARTALHQMGVEYSEQQFAKSAGAGDKTAVELFLDAGMDVNAGGGAAIGLAAGRGQLEMVKLLLARGAKPTSNALQFARTRGHTEIAKLLSDAGAKE